MKIGELAARTGASHRALRHYEQQHLIESSRRQNGYREYAPSAVQRVQWIKELIDCGFSTREIRGLLANLQNNDPGSESFHHWLDQHLEKLDALNSSLATLLERRQRLFERLERFRLSSEKVTMAVQQQEGQDNARVDRTMEAVTPI